MSDAPLVSILTVNYNQAAVTADLLRSLRRIRYPNIEIVVVDNGSREDCRWLSESFSEIRLLLTGKNLGFAGGNNYGLPFCSGAYVLFINNDVEVEPDFLEPLIKAFEEFPKVGMVSPRIHYFGEPGLIQYAGSTPMSPFTIRNATIGFRQKDVGQYLDVRPTAFIHGAAMVVSREVIETVGTMSDDYFLYYEELDWCSRIVRSGYQVIYVGTSLVHHKESVSVGKMSSLKIYYMTRNRLLYARRNFPFKERLISMLFFCFVSVPKGLIVYLVKGEFALAGAFLKGVYWNIIH
ncbi:glycosyltransferase [bacterium]|nr:glycosyltransferase [bacterium]